MDDLPERETPRVWIAAGIFLAAITLAFVMLIYNSIRAEAQEQPLCAPANILIPQFAEIHKERPVWGGIIPLQQGPVEAILLQSARNTWTFLTIRGGVACIVAAGKDATPVETGKGV